MKAIGLMSGTSLDGLDICLSNFELKNGKWQFEILQAESIPYSKELQENLNLINASAIELVEAHKQFGRFSANAVNAFLARHGIHHSDIYVIGSHGHTVFHNPSKGINFQIGDGSVIAALTGIDTVCDFRSTDVALDGNGAPLVPIGDEILFNSYDACLNLGGFANISFHLSDSRMAFDIGPCNVALNRIASLLGQPFDDKGLIAASGKLIPSLLEQLKALPYFQSIAPKSLGIEWFEQHYYPLVAQFIHKHPTENILHTTTKHIAFEIAKILDHLGLKSVLTTGGGAKNDFLIQLINDNKNRITLPTLDTIDYKEALIFSFLGLLRKMEMVNVKCSYTGAKKDSISGALYKS